MPQCSVQSVSHHDRKLPALLLVTGNYRNNMNTDIVHDITVTFIHTTKYILILYIILLLMSYTTHDITVTFIHTTKHILILYIIY